MSDKKTLERDSQELTSSSPELRNESSEYQKQFLIFLSQPSTGGGKFFFLMMQLLELDLIVSGSKENPQQRKSIHLTHASLHWLVFFSCSEMNK